ncbi:MAG: anti-sigma regulatory factor [Draconibacterium sp.]|nr:anti-sigma regulatory factor [Draconibacterium sp.]
MDAVEFDNHWDELGEYPVETEHDIVKVRQTVRYHAKKMGMGLVDQTRITTAVSELFRNMYNYAGRGMVTIQKGFIKNKFTLVVTCTDEGPGIDDVELAMCDGYTTGQGMGYGLPGAQRLVDSFDIESEKGAGTTVRVMKWK